MTRHQSVPRTASRVIVAAAGALALTAAVTTSASAATPTESVPAAGDVVTCQSVGALTGTSGYLRQQERTIIDGRGRAHVLFTIAADRVQLVGPDGRSYRLVGGGYDYVVYPGRAVTGDVVREAEQFHFDVIADHHVVGVVRFRLRTRSDQVPHIHDASTCQLPNMS